MPFVNPLIEHDVVVLVQVFPLGDAVAVYPVIALPPFDDGAVHEIVSLPLPERAAVAPVGAPGVAQVVTDPLIAEPGPVPCSFVAVTLKVYAVPASRLRTVQELPDDWQVRPPGDAVTV